MLVFWSSSSEVGQVSVPYQSHDVSTKNTILHTNTHTWIQLWKEKYKSKDFYTTNTIMHKSLRTLHNKKWPSELCETHAGIPRYFELFVLLKNSFWGFIFGASIRMYQLFTFSWLGYHGCKNRIRPMFIFMCTDSSNTVVREIFIKNYSR